MNSCLYTGWVRHRRHHPRVHDFRYRLFLAYLDLDELDHLDRTVAPFCHDAGGALAAVVAEVDNTFGERYLYLLAR